MLEVGLVELIGLPTIVIGKSKVTKTKRTKRTKKAKRCCGMCDGQSQNLSIKSLRNIVSIACIEHNVTPEMIAQAAKITTAHNIAGVRAAITKGQKILV